MYDHNYRRQMLERITEMADGVADVRAYDDAAHGIYQIMCLFRYPLGNRLEIDEYYNDIQDVLGEDWSLKLSAEPAGDGIIVKISARLKYENEKAR